jgi:tetratricopeptide (TPR) repeat protein
MNKHVVLAGFAFLAIVLVGAVPAGNVEELVRKGNEAMHNKQYQDALDWYQKAGERSTDPGLLAYNQGIAHYHLGHFREAELLFRRCLEDAAGARRAQALYGLGNSLLMQAGKADVALLKDAIKCYQLCRQQPELPGELLAGTNHNLELARLLLAQALLEAQQPPPNDGPEPPNNKNNGQEPSDDPKGPGMKDGSDTDPNKGSMQSTEPLDPLAQSKGKIPQRGKPPVIPDDDKLVPMPAEDTAAYLQQLTDRIMQETQQALSGKTGPLPGVKDW